MLSPVHSAAGCIGDNFIREIEDLMRPGTSVLFVVDTAGDLKTNLESIRGLGGRVLKTNVDLDRRGSSKRRSLRRRTTTKVTQSPAEVKRLVHLRRT